MPRSCTVCSHPARHRIDTALALGTPSRRELADLHAVTPSALTRHKRAHLSTSLAAQAQTRAAVREAGGGGPSIMDRLESLVAESEALVTYAKGSGEGTKAVAASLRELRQSIELYGRATGELTSGPAVEVNMVQSSEWAEVRSRILLALAPFPEARQAVADALTGAQPVPKVLDVPSDQH